MKTLLFFPGSRALLPVAGPIMHGPDSPCHAQLPRREPRILTIAANSVCPPPPQVPWDDLRYIFGEIMYGGHIVEDWDRRLANAYLLRYMNEQLLEGMEMFPGFVSPPNTLNHRQVLDYLDEQMPAETPLAFGLHPNAEIGFKLREAETFCNSLVQLQPREAGGEGGMSVEEKAKMVLDDLVERLPDNVSLCALRGACEGGWVGGSSPGGEAAGGRESWGVRLRQE